jgi:hypothetical protein
MKNYSNFMLQAKNVPGGMGIYLRASGREYLLTWRRRCGLLYARLKDGVTLGELRRLKPRKSRAAQKYYHYTRHLLKVAEDYIANGLAA